jgi:hypothetical protein
MSSLSSEALRRLALESDLYPHGISEELWREETGPRVVCIVRPSDSSDLAALDLLRSIIEKGLGIAWAECLVVSSAPFPPAPLVIAFGVEHDVTTPVIETDPLVELLESREKKRLLWENLKALRVQR